jgi:tetratricopeptide (TPR) repeat protein
MASSPAASAESLFRPAVPQDQGRFAEARAGALAALGRPEKAFASHARAIALNADFSEAHLGVGLLLDDPGKHRPAIANYDKAITARALDPRAYVNRGNALCALKDYESAIASFQRALSLGPDVSGLLGACQHARMQLCDWGVLMRELRN